MIRIIIAGVIGLTLAAMVQGQDRANSWKYWQTYTYYSEQPIVEVRGIINRTKTEIAWIENDIRPIRQIDLDRLWAHRSLLAEMQKKLERMEREEERRYEYKANYRYQERFEDETWQGDRPRQPRLYRTLPRRDSR